jgi:hypothetical protein
MALTQDVAATDISNFKKKSALWIKQEPHGARGEVFVALALAQTMRRPHEQTCALKSALRFGHVVMSVHACKAHMAWARPRCDVPS